MESRWLDWVKRLQAIAQNGLAYTEGVYDRERYNQIIAIAAEIAAAGSGAPLERVEGLYRHERGYATPKIDVRGAVFRDDSVLMVRELVDSGRWTLPGGYADVGEPPSLATAREVFEESGFEVRAVRLLALYDRDNPRHGHPPHEFQLYKVFFDCEITGGAPRPSIETGEVRFFRRGDLPNDLSLGRITRSQIERLFELHDHPEWPADFD